MKQGLAVRGVALFLAISLMVMPQALNSRSLILLMDEYGTMPAPLAEEEEVKHACSISWSTILHATDDHLIKCRGFALSIDPYNEVEHGEVDVPPPKG